MRDGRGRNSPRRMRPGWARLHCRYLRLDAVSREAVDHLSVAIDGMPGGRERDAAIEYLEDLLYGEDA